MLVDSHCHLDFPDFKEDFEGVLSRAAGAGVGYMVTISTRLSEYDTIRNIAESYDNIGFAVGVHPHNAAEEGQDDPAEIIRLCDHDKVVAIGESGLDYYYNHSPREAQRNSFRTHLRACSATGLPIVVHTRDAEEDTIAILKEECAAAQSQGKPIAGVIHCFSSNYWLAEEAVKLGFYISLSGILTFKKSTDIQDSVRKLPIERLLIETDAPFLAPSPHRGKRNEPAYVAHVASKIAELKALRLNVVEETTTQNFFTLFNRAKQPSGSAN